MTIAAQIKARRATNHCKENPNVIGNNSVDLSDPDTGRRNS
jgi:hypothetical protein